jgi:O-acetylhomoserine (thiol)-lyase
LKAHRQNQLATTLFHKFGAILSIELSDNINPIAFLNSLRLVLSATHLGDTRTLALPVAATIFHENGAQARADMGISDRLIRISVGIENINDLIDDFKQAFKASL